MGLSFLIHCAGWVASAISTWIALLLMGVHVRVTSVLAIESLICAARSIAFLVPNAIGIQEAAYAAVAPLFGIGSEVGLAISLLKRVRDVAVGVPILLLWQGAESRRFLAYTRAATIVSDEDLALHDKRTRQSIERRGVQWRFSNPRRTAAIGRRRRRFEIQKRDSVIPRNCRRFVAGDLSKGAES